MKLFKKEKTDTHKIITIFGVKLKLKRKNANENDVILEQIKPIEPIKEQKCKICGVSAKKVFSASVFHNKYEAEYYFCYECGFLHINNPIWLNEAYNTPVTSEDTGILWRNQQLQKYLSIILFNLFGKDGKYLDYGGGYGFLTRFMRDIGFDFYHWDKYSKNITAQGFEGDLNENYSAITTIETFEHFLNPLEEIETMLNMTDTILFSEDLLPFPVPKPQDW